jgi:predicted NBD/HSP70 family sugar kinase
MSEGVGAAVVYNAEIYRGSSNFHSMLGHLVVEPHGKQCDCGKRGCLELYASRSELMGEDPEPAGSRTTKVADYVARGIGSMIDLFGIEDVAIGGKTIADLPLMFDQIREAIPRYVYTPTIRDLSIRRSRHGNHSVATSAGLWLVDTVLKELPMQR